MAIHRVYQPNVINLVLNDPSVRPHVGGVGTLDLGPLLVDERNVLLMEGEVGGVFFHWQEPGVYEAHTQYLPEGRGARAFEATREAVDWLFSHTDAMELYSKAPGYNTAANTLARALGARVAFRREGAWLMGDGSADAVNYWALPHASWALSSPSAKALGHNFHLELEAKLPDAEPHPDDPAHDSYVGATIMTLRAGQVAKAVVLYNRWARFAGYEPIALISLNPLVIDIKTAKLLLTADGFEVL